MKRKVYILVLLLVVAQLAQAQSAAYLRYSQNSNLDVAYVEGFQVDSTTAVDVTVIIANDSATMEGLIDEFGFRLARAIHKVSPTSLMSAHCSKDDPTQRMEGDDTDIVIVSVYYRRISIYHITSPKQKKAIFLAEVLRHSNLKNKQQ